MTTTRTEVYCLTCNKLVDSSKVTTILKTGFYKITIPLASNCNVSADAPDVIEEELCL